MAWRRKPLCGTDYFGGCNSPLLTHPEALTDLSGSPASQFLQRNVPRPLPPEGSTIIAVAPHWGQVVCAICPTAVTCRRIQAIVIRAFLTQPDSLRGADVA